MSDLKLDALYVVYPGLHRYKFADRVEGVPLWAVLKPLLQHEPAMSEV